MVCSSVQLWLPTSSLSGACGRAACLPLPAAGLCRARLKKSMRVSQNSQGSSLAPCQPAWGAAMVW